MMKKIMVFICLGSSYAIALPSLTQMVDNAAHKACSLLFGKKDVGPELLAQATAIRQSYGLNPDQTRIKYIAPEKKWLSPFLSFTWFGTWIDKKAFEQMSPQEKAFTLEHEFAHEYLNHPVKQIGLFLSTVAGSALFNTLVVKPSMQKYLANYASTHLIKGTQAALLITLTTLVCSQYVRYCEKQADLIAVQQLKQISH